MGDAAIANSQVLVVGPDAALPAELDGVLSTLDDAKRVIRHVGEYRRAGEAARSWRPDVAFLEMDGDLENLRIVARDIQAVSPETWLVGVFRNDLFDPDVPESALLIQAIRAGVQDFVRRPVSRTDVLELFGRLVHQRGGAPAQLGKLVSFISNKGGVGKSTLAVNTAVALARRHPERVLLLDCSLQMGVCAALLGLRPKTTILDAARESRRLDETLVRQLATPHASGLDLLAAPANAVEATEVDDEIISRLLTLARRAYDYVVVDTFPMFDRIVMSVLDVSNHTYIVLDNLVPTVLGVAELLKVLNTLGYSEQRQSLVVNRFTKILGSLLVPDIEARLDRDVAHVVGYGKGVITASNIGQPFVLRAGWISRIALAMNQLADDVEQRDHAPVYDRNQPTATDAPEADPTADTRGPHGDNLLRQGVNGSALAPSLSIARDESA